MKWTTNSFLLINDFNRCERKACNAFCIFLKTTFKVRDSNNHIVLLIDIGGNWISCLFGGGIFKCFKRDKIKVYKANGVLLGKVCEGIFLSKPRYSIKDANDEVVLQVKGYSNCCWFQNQVFEFKCHNGTVLGQIDRKKFCASICWPLESNYALHLNKSLSPDLKALSLATIALIEMRLSSMILSDAIHVLVSDELISNSM